MFKKISVLLPALCLSVLVMFALFACKKGPVTETISGKIEVVTILSTVATVPVNMREALRDITVVQADGKRVFVKVYSPDREVFKANEGKPVTLTGEMVRNQVHYMDKVFDLCILKDKDYKITQ